MPDEEETRGVSTSQADGGACSVWRGTRRCGTVTCKIPLQKREAIVSFGAEYRGSRNGRTMANDERSAREPHSRCGWRAGAGDR